MLNKPVSEVMVTGEEIPSVKDDCFFRDALEEMTNKHHGGVAIVDSSNVLKGIIVDGDMKRFLMGEDMPISHLYMHDIKEVMIKDPKSLTPDTTVKAAIELMTSKQIWCMPVVDSENKLVGFFQMVALLEELIQDPAFKGA